MNEERRSIWKRLWNRPRLRIFFCLLLTLLLLLAEVAGFTKIMEQTRQHMPGVFMFAALGVTLLAALLLLFTLVIPARLRQQLFHPHRLRRYLFGLASLVTLVALFYVEEDFRGRRAWRQYVRELEAKGEKMKLIEFAPPPVPDDQNLAMCPLLRPLLEYSPVSTAEGSPVNWRGDVIWHDTNGLKRVQRLDLRYSEDGAASSARAKAEEELDAHPLTNGWINLAAWQRYFRTRTNFVVVDAGAHSPTADVLAALSPFGPDLAELQREADRRPLARWPVHYDTDPPAAVLLPHLGYGRRIVRVLQLRAAARLDAGDVEGALADIRLGWRLADSIREEAMLISQIVRVEEYRDLLQPLREGLTRHQFSDSQLAQVQEKLGSVDLLSGYALAMRNERAMVGQLSTLSEADLHELVPIMSGQGADNRTLIQLSFLFLFAPSGWIYQNQLSICQLEERYLFPAIDPAKRLAYPDRARGYSAASKAARGPFHLAARIWLLQFLPASPQRFASCQADVDQARVACALERFRLAHGPYPATLDELATAFPGSLPHDLIGGHPLKYRRTAAGGYILYSIGWNEKDDGGQAVANSDGTPNLDQGDWVWRLPGR